MSLRYLILDFQNKVNNRSGWTMVIEHQILCSFTNILTVIHIFKMVLIIYTSIINYNYCPNFTFLCLAVWTVGESYGNTLYLTLTFMGSLYFWNDRAMLVKKACILISNG